MNKKWHDSSLIVKAINRRIKLKETTNNLKFWKYIFSVNFNKIYLTSDFYICNVIKIYSYVKQNKGHIGNKV